MADLEKNLQGIKLPAGFKISVHASGVNSARQVAWGDKGTLFVGSLGVGAAYAITDNGDNKSVEAVLTDRLDPKFVTGHTCSEFTPPALWHLVYFRSGRRKSLVMQPTAASLSDDIVSGLSWQFSSQKTPVSDVVSVMQPAMCEAGQRLVMQNRSALCRKDNYSGVQAVPRTANQ